MLGRAFLTIAYFGVVVLCVSFSTFTTFKGSEAMVGGWQLAAMLAAIVALCLMAADFRIRDDILNQGRVNALAIGLLAAAILISSLSHFNYFFTSFQGSQIARDAYRTQVARFEENMAIAAEALRNHGPLAEHSLRTQGVESGLARLRTELDDPSEQGFGEDAFGVTMQVRQLVGSEMAPLDDPDLGESREAVYNPWYETFTREARAALSRLKPPEATADENQINAIIAARAEVATFQTDISDPDSPVGAAAVMTETQELFDFSNEVRVYMIGRGLLDQAQEFTDINTREGETGEIAYTLAQAARPQNLLVTMLSIVLSLFVDLVPLLFALATFRQSEGGYRIRTPKKGPRAYSP